MCVGLVNLPVEQYDFGLFHLLRRALSADFRQTYPSHLTLASLILRIFKALCLNIFVPGIFRVQIEAIVLDGELRNIVHVALENLLACFVYADRRVMDFRRRPGPDQPNAQMFEDVPNDRRVFNAADDPHGTLALRADQGICLIDLLNKTRPVPPEDLFIPLGFEDAGDSLVAAVLLPFSP